MFQLIYQYREMFLGGLLTTLKLVLWIYPLGFVLGGLAGYARFHWPRAVNSWFSPIVLVISSTPILVLLFWLHYPLQFLLQIVVDPFITTVVGLCLVMAFIVSNQVRTALIDFPAHYVLSARACGLSKKLTYQQIVFPMLFRSLLPGALFTMITILQATLFASMIGVNELFRVAQQVNSQVYRPVEVYSSLAIFFAVICGILNIIAFRLKASLKWTLNDL